MNRIALAIAVMYLSAGHALPQALPSAEARSQEEFDLYVDFHETSVPEARHQAALRFARTYPDSKLLADMYESEFDYLRSRGDGQGAIAAGRNLLRMAPSNVKALLGLAEVVPNGTSDPAVLDTAEAYARKALLALRELQFTHDVSLSECEAVQRALGARAHAAIGYVFGKEGKIGEGIKELETEVAMSPEAVGS